MRSDCETPRKILGEMHTAERNLNHSHVSQSAQCAAPYERSQSLNNLKGYPQKSGMMSGGAGHHGGTTLNSIAGAAAMI